MKPGFSLYKDYKDAGKNRKPILTISDLARELGMTQQTLSRRFKEDGNPLPVKFAVKNAKYYDAAELRKWASTLVIRGR